MSRVVVLGSSAWDLAVRVPHLPRPGETCLGGSLIEGPGGKGANAAVAAKRAGGDVSFISAIGDDDFGDRIRGSLEQEGIPLEWVRVVPETSSQLALIFLAENGENSIAVAPGASVLLAPSYIEQLPDSLFAQGGAFLASCEVPIETVVAGLKRARAHGMHTILNPAPARELSILAEALRFTEILTPNEGELATLLRTPAVDNGLSCDQMRKLGSMGVMAIVVTRGDRGCQILADESEPIDIPPHVVHAVDSVGAGDAFSGALAVALTERAWLRGAARFANAAAALAVTKPSAQGGMPSRREIEELLAKSGSADSTLSEAIQ